MRAVTFLAATLPAEAPLVETPALWHETPLGLSVVFVAVTASVVFALVWAGRR